MNSKDLHTLVNVISNEINELKLEKQVKSSKNYPTYDATISIMESFIELIQKVDQDIYEKPKLTLPIKW